MKAPPFITAAGVALAVLASGQAQTTFTKITSGDIVSDSGGVGVAWGDFNNDGYLDLFVSNYGGKNMFYRNNGNGTFTKLTQPAPVQDDDTHTIPSWGDYDNDGNLDLLVPAGLQADQPTHTKLYHNNGDGTFTLLNDASLANASGYFGGGWVDYNNDGFLDLFIGNLPAGQDGTNLLFRNDGAGTFSETDLTPLTTDASQGFAYLWADYDNDGLVDLLIVNSKGSSPNLLYHNEGHGAFKRVLTGVLATDHGPENGIGGAWGDYDNDGLLAGLYKLGSEKREKSPVNTRRNGVPDCMT